MIAPKIKYVDLRPNGVLRFRRRFPKDVAEHLGKSHLQVHIRNTSGVAFHREYQAILNEFDKIVTQTRAQIDPNVNDLRTGPQRWHDAMMKAAGLKEGVFGLDPDDPETGRLIIETMKEKLDPLVAKALVYPTAPAPKATLKDAFKLYHRDKHIEAGSKKDVDLRRIEKRVEAALGDLDGLPLEDMSVEHRRKWLDHMLASKKADGSTLALGSAKKESNILVAVVNHALAEMDITARNRFSSLPWPEEDTAALDLKNPLKDDLVERMNERLSGELKLLWSVLAGTGMRLSEAVGLLREDVVLDHPTPHVIVRPNSIRRIKTASSQRTVPLVGDALRAVENACEGVQPGLPIIPRYGRKRGGDAASAALMKHLRLETSDPRFTVHGLRHTVSDKLREAGAPVEVRQGFLGHALQDISENWTCHAFVPPQVLV